MTSEQETAMYDQPSGVPREALIEAAATAMQKRMTWRSLYWPNTDAIQHSDVATALASAALTVFEEAHTPTECRDCGRTDGGCDRIMDTPTDDEREALSEIIGHVFYNSHQDPTGHTADAILAAGFHRTVKGEPSRDREAQGMSEAEDYARDTEPSKRAETVDDFMTGWRTADRTRVQGEPSDAAVEAAAVAAYRAGACRYVNMFTLGQWMRAALKAAAAVQGGEAR